ncbi:MAG: SCP2 sterol-binding domain-containing protein [Ideonella sp.]|nr:SCP2 sterol-binding domain-containing protein [Ideonella sp.]
MTRKSLLAAALAITAAAALPAVAQTPAVAMSPPWAQAMCAAWNADATLTDKLVESGWIKNDGGRGHKLMQIYRADCPKSERIEMQIALKDGKAQCVYGGAARAAKLDGAADYLMWAETPRWREMGAGDYGPMRAMMFGRLEFAGPKMEAMGNMGPFSSFLLLVGKVPGDWAACP